MANRALVLDANILIRAVLGTRVRLILDKHADNVSFFVPETAYLEAEGHLATLVTKRGGDAARALGFLRAVLGLCDLVGADLYGDFEAEARRRLGARDPDDSTIGRFLRPPLRLVAPSGPKTPTSSDAAFPLGRPIASRYS
jgi:predicted nucleic acid-binding protein